MAAHKTPEELRPNTIRIKLSPQAFHMWADHYYRTRSAVPIEGFSPVPYFLLCRSIELALKSCHLHTRSQREVKNTFSHRLDAAYHDLEAVDRVLLPADVEQLAQASALYSGKGFEYFHPDHALRGYSEFPELDTLDRIAEMLIAVAAKKLTDADSE